VICRKDRISRQPSTNPKRKRATIQQIIGDGRWALAVDVNDGGTKTFVLGPWDKSYGLDAYGVDLNDNTAWAVVNHASDFAVGAVPAAGPK
jgi:hypothetical protein